MALVENSSILMSIKKLLNVEHNDPAFDTDIGMAINGVFMTLHQLGVGPEEGFSITEADTKWSDFSDDKTLIETVKMYVYMKVRMIFDPPASSIVADAFNNQIHELEFRLNVQAERNWKNETEIIPEAPEDSNTENSEPETEPSEGISENQNETTQNTTGRNYQINGEQMVLFGNIF